jgi:molybdopterin molybdotransferase
VPIGAADRRVLAQDAVAQTDLPAADTSAMDGWAVAGSGPWVVVGQVLAGSAPDLALQAGQACLIATGAAVPPGAAGIVRREAGRLVEGRLETREELRDDIRPRGQECRAGEVLAAAGTTLAPAHVGMLAAAGLDEVLVRARPRVAVVLFGDELVEAGTPGPGQVRDSLGPQLPGWLERLGAEVVQVGRSADTLDAHTAAIAQARQAADVVVTTGGTASGPVDHLHHAVAELGGAFLVDSVAVRPGHPMALASFAGTAPAGARWLLGLPGNPQSAVVSLLTLGAPLLDGMLLRSERALPLVALTTGAAAPAAEHRLLACTVHGDQAAPVEHLGSAMLRGLAAADGFAVLPPGGAAAGQRVPMLALPR